MTPGDVKMQRERIEKFDALQHRIDRLRQTLSCIGTDNASPFTSDWREARQVDLLSITFTRTRGGAPPVVVSVMYSELSASKLGQFLRTEIEATIAELVKEQQNI